MTIFLSILYLAMIFSCCKLYCGFCSGYCSWCSIWLFDYRISNFREFLNDWIGTEWSLVIRIKFRSRTVFITYFHGLAFFIITIKRSKPSSSWQHGCQRLLPHIEIVEVMLDKQVGSVNMSVVWCHHHRTSFYVPSNREIYSNTPIDIFLVIKSHSRTCSRTKRFIDNYLVLRIQQVHLTFLHVFSKQFPTLVLRNSISCCIKIFLILIFSAAAIFFEAVLRKINIGLK